MNTLPRSGDNAHQETDSAGFKNALDLCVRKTRVNIKHLADHPKTWSSDVAGRYENFKEDFYEIGNWTSSFFTGMALLAWRETEDEFFLKQTLRLAPYYREKVFTRHLDTHHDLGFLYSLFSVALYKLTGDQQHREVGLRSAEVLAQRFNEKGSFIRAWGHMNTTEHDNMAIIDSLMNLPLLFWAYKESGLKKYHQTAVRHADMSLQCFIRPDGSVNHAFRFDLKTGQPLAPDSYCGFSKDSYWARGAAWAVYGLALCGRYTGAKRYLDASRQVAEKFVAQLDAEVVPVWDFRLPKNAAPVRDASAAAIMVCGLQELQRLEIADVAMIEAKQALLKRICRDDYLDSNPGCRGVLKSGYGAKVAFSSWGDYFLMEALSREFGLGETFW